MERYLLYNMLPKISVQCSVGKYVLHFWGGLFRLHGALFEKGRLRLQVWVIWPFFICLLFHFASSCSKFLWTSVVPWAGTGQGWNNIQQLKNCKLIQSFFGKKYICRQPVGFCCTHWDHFIWPEVQYELKTKLLSFWLTAVQTLSFWNQTAAEMSL